MSDRTTEATSLSVPCPTCGKTVPWTTASRFRPFCSKRCHLIDLGDWVTEGHRIPGEPAEDELMSEEMGRYRDS